MQCASNLQQSRPCVGSSSQINFAPTCATLYNIMNKRNFEFSKFSKFDLLNCSRFLVQGFASPLQLSKSNVALGAYNEHKELMWCAYSSAGVYTQHYGHNIDLRCIRYYTLLATCDQLVQIIHYLQISAQVKTSCNLQPFGLCAIEWV